MSIVVNLEEGAEQAKMMSLGPFPCSAAPTRLGLTKNDARIGSHKVTLLITLFHRAQILLLG